MNTLLDNLFLFGQAVSLMALVWGAWLVLRESLAGVVFPARKSFRPTMSFKAGIAHFFRRIARA